MIINTRTVRSIGGGSGTWWCLQILGQGMQHDKTTISKNNAQWVNQYSNNTPTMGPLHQKLTNAQINRDSAHILSMTPKHAYWISKLEIDRDWKLIAKNLWNMHALRSKRVQVYRRQKSDQTQWHSLQVVNLVIKMSPHFERVLNWSITIATNIWPKACTVFSTCHIRMHTYTYILHYICIFNVNVHANRLEFQIWQNRIHKGIIK